MQATFFGGDVDVGGEEGLGLRANEDIWTSGGVCFTSWLFRGRWGLVIVSNGMVIVLSLRQSGVRRGVGDIAKF